MTTLLWCLLAIYLFCAFAIFVFAAATGGRPVVHSFACAVLWPLVVLAAGAILVLFRFGFLKDLD